MSKRLSFLAKCRYLWHAAVAYFFYAIFCILPPAAASALGGFIGRVIGWRHEGSRRALRNLQLVLPERAAEHKTIIRGMWDNFGRILGEYPHLQKIWNDGHIEVVGAENLPVDPKGVVFLTAHLANWEIAPTIALQNGWDMAVIYRPLNNIYLDSLLRRVRNGGEQKLFTKSAEGAMELMRHVRRGGAAGLLVDQRLTDGVNVPFFGQPALTSQFPAILALRYGARLLPARVERINGIQQRLTLYPMLKNPDQGSENEKIVEITSAINNMFEQWIRARPDQWLWSHRRWRLKKKKKNAIL